MHRARLNVRLRNAVLGVALLLGQWLVLAHVIEHPALAPEQACQICLYGQGLDSGAMAPTLAALPDFAPVAPEAVVPAATAARPRPSLYRARAPPRFLA